MSKKSVLDFREMKRTGKKITFLTSYDYPTANLAEQCGIDMLLVGDSVGMVVYGYAGTLPVTMDQMIVHTEAVRRAAPNTFVIGDMPFLSYQTSVNEAIKNAGLFHAKAGVDAIKLEGGKRVVPQIRGIVDSGMLVMGHIGLTPQSSGQLGGFKAQGTTADEAVTLVDDAKAVEGAGAFAILVEGVPAEVGKFITEGLRIPVLSIGAGPYCDGQLLIVSDMLGLFEVFTPKFVKQYAKLAEIVRGAFKSYIDDVITGRFPETQHCYKMKPGEAEKLATALRKQN